MTIRRLAIIAGVLFVILIGISVYTFAILLPSTSAASTSQATLSNGTLVPAVTATVVRSGKGRKYTGTIQSTGNQTFTMVLSTGKNKTITVNVDTNTTFTTTTGTGTFSDLKVGDTVQVRGRADPQDATAVLAVSILVTSTGGQ